MGNRRPVRGSTILLGLAAGLVLLATLTPRPGWVPRGTTTLIPSGTRGLRDILANVCLFVPFGVAMAARGYGYIRVAAGTMALSALVELCQLGVPGRFPTVSDVVANSAGGVAGLILGRLAGVQREDTWLNRTANRAQRLLQPGATWSLRLAVAAAIIPTLLARASAWLAYSHDPCTPCWVSGMELHTSDSVLLGGIGASSATCGRLDDIRIYDRALSVSEIRSGITAAPRERVTDAGLVAAFEFDAAEAPLRSPLPLPGRLAGARWTPHGRVGGGLELDRMSDGATIGPAPQLRLQQAMTIEAWLWPHTDRCGPAIVAWKGGSAYLDAGSAREPLRPYGGAIIGGLFETVASSVRLEVQKWTHLALTFDGRTLRLMVNGSVEAVRHVSSARPVLRFAPPSAIDDGAARRSSLPPWSEGVLHVEFGPPTGSAPTSGRAPLFRAVSGRAEVMSVGLNDRSLNVHHASRLTAFGGPFVVLRVPELSTPVPDDRPMVLEFVRHDRRLTLRVDQTRVPIGLTPNEWWTLIVFTEELPDRVARAVTFAVGALVLLPLGYLRSNGLEDGWVVVCSRNGSGNCGAHRIAAADVVGMDRRRVGCDGWSVGTPTVVGRHSP